MSGDFIRDFLAKLSAKTGRKWTLLDLVRLAEKLPDLNENNIDAFLAELSELGLILPQEKKEVLKRKVVRKEGVTAEDLEQLKKRFVEKQARAAGQRGKVATQRVRTARLGLNLKRKKGERQLAGTVLSAAKGSLGTGKRQAKGSGRLAARSNVAGQGNRAAAAQRRVTNAQQNAANAAAAASPRSANRQVNRPTVNRQTRQVNQPAANRQSSRQSAARRLPPRVRRRLQANTNPRTLRRPIAGQQSELLPAERQYMAKVARQLRQLRRNRLLAQGSAL